MKQRLLNGSDWQLTGYWRHQWRVRPPDENHPSVRAALPPIAAVVPGAVHADLRRAGLLPDWNAGLNSLACEWVNHRDWAFVKRFVVPADFDGRLTLECDGLDYAGQVSLNGRVIGTFEGTHRRHAFDVTGIAKPGEAARLEIIVEATPEIDGVYGYTSRIRIFKPRFGYCWDWCPRLVNVGIWQDVRLVCRGEARLRDPRARATLDADNRSGHAVLSGDIDGEAASVRHRLLDDRRRVVASGERAVAAGPLALAFDVPDVQPWWPATHGDQPLYRLEVELLDASGRVSDTCAQTLGFKRVRWLDNPGAPAGARPYLCEINDRTIWLRGVNWVPLSPFYGTVSADRYETVLRLYRHLHANVLRVWGGAILERPDFYDTCDRLGLLVWQEFPLSSSGIDNWPPEDPDAIAALRRIAEEHVLRRGHHACHLLWCGGNELQGALDGGKVGIGKPVDESHPCMRMFAEVVERLDPGKRCLPTSPSGPRFFAAPADFGKGLHHQTHGPWGNLPLATRYDYFNGDDSLFRSETGAPGCSSLDWIERNRGTQRVWPPRPDNPFWLHPAAAWIPWDDVTREFGPVADDERELPFIVKASRYIQAESYRYAIEAARRRMPQCSGFIVWMGHDAAFCTSNNSLLEQPGWPKPAYAWVQRAFAPRHVSLRHDRIAVAAGERLHGEVWAHRTAGDAPADARVTARLLSVRGDEVARRELAARLDGQESVACGEIDFDVPDAPHGLLLVELVMNTDDERNAPVANRYLLSQQAEHSLAPLRALPTARLTIVEHAAVDRRRRRLVLRNDGAVAAIGVELAARSAASVVMADRGSVVVLPGESVEIRYEVLGTFFGGGRRSRDARLRVEWFNADAPLSVGRAV